MIGRRKLSGKRRRIRRYGRINARGQEALAVRHSVEAAPLQKVARQRTDIRNVEHRVEADVALHAEAEVIRRRRIKIADGCRIDARRVDAQWRRQQIVDSREVGRRRDQVRRLLDLLQHLIIVEAVVEDAYAAANRCLAVAEQIVSEADARPELNPWRVVARAL